MFDHHEEEAEGHEAPNAGHNSEEAMLIKKDAEGAEQTSETQVRINEYQRLIRQEMEETHGHSLQEVYIHQLIETIEFVLGAVSNTASYLRLWALSLAHSQLALVFLEQILKIPIVALPADSLSAQAIGCFIIWFPFMAVTFAVLMMMDVLECFLHTLRLHWVEFQSKFYKG